MERVISLQEINQYSLQSFSLSLFFRINKLFQTSFNFINFKASKIQMPYEKSVEEYRRDIFGLKTKLKQEEKYLEQLKQKYSEVDIFGDEKSYTFGLKLKILEYNLASVTENMAKYAKDEAYDFYALNFATLALIKSTEVLMINREMIFRAVDLKSQGKVTAFQFTSFLKDSLKMSQEFIKPIIEVLDVQNKGIITRQRYKKYLQCFLINTEQQNEQVTTIDVACQNIIKQIIIQNNSNPASFIHPELIWKAKEINIAVFCQGLMRKFSALDRLDCVGMYCKLDPLKRGYLETKDAVNYITNKINDMKAFGQGSVKLKK